MYSATTVRAEQTFKREQIRILNNDGNYGPTAAWAFYPNSFGYLETEDNSRNGQNYIRAIY